MFRDLAAERRLIMDEVPKGSARALPISITIDGYLDTEVLYDAGQETKPRKMGKIILEHRLDGKLYVNGVKVVRYLSPNQKNGRMINGGALYGELKGQRVLNACIMDALFANQQLIPDAWKTGRTYFWGTLFHTPKASGLSIGFLWFEGEWRKDSFALDLRWSDDEFAAFLAS